MQQEVDAECELIGIVRKRTRRDSGESNWDTGSNWGLGTGVWTGESCANHSVTLLTTHEVDDASCARSACATSRSTASNRSTRISAISTRSTTGGSPSGIAGPTVGEAGHCFEIKLRGSMMGNTAKK